MIGACRPTPRPRASAPGPLPRSYVPLNLGPGPRYRPRIRQLTERSIVAGLTCRPELGPRVAVHLELFANRHVVLISPGIGVVGPVRSGAFVRGARCYFPLLTLDPTGVVALRPDGPSLALGDLFALWGQPLTNTRLAGFAGHPVHAFVDGRPVAGDPVRIRLRRHAEIVLEIGGYVVPHDSYRFAGG